MIELWSQAQLAEVLPDDTVFAIFSQLRFAALTHGEAAALPVLFGWEVRTFEIDDDEVSALLLSDDVNIFVIATNGNLTREQRFAKSVPQPPVIEYVGANQL